ncbi:hypothetical protein SRABI96_02755 [Peribacillus sp. Bi96]|nr:hypothetical protein SRABI96_02755 [Peribacillus sp. Bi96]
MNGFEILNLHNDQGGNELKIEQKLIQDAHYRRLFVALLMVSYFILDFTFIKGVVFSIFIVIIASLINLFDKRKNVKN